MRKSSSPASWGGGEIGDAGRVGAPHYVDESNYIGPAQTPFERSDRDAVTAPDDQE